MPSDPILTLTTYPPYLHFYYTAMDLGETTFLEQQETHSEPVCGPVWLVVVLFYETGFSEAQANLKLPM